MEQEGAEDVLTSSAASEHICHVSLYTTHIFGAAFGLGMLIKLRLVFVAHASAGCSVLVSGHRPHENPDNAPR
eukprot:751001-Hanusia_phi.AAC.1